jgi:hypothetical protein
LPSALALIEATMREADLMADLAIGFLRAEGLAPDPSQGGAPVALPAAFYLELGAVLRIATWERAGIRDLLDPGLPSADSAYAGLLRRLVHEPESFGEGGRPTPLLDRVMLAAWRRLAWAGRPGLGADVALGPVDDSALDALAQFLYAHRRRGAGRRPN